MQKNRLYETARDQIEINFSAKGERGFSCSSAPLPTGRARLEQPHYKQPPQRFGWAIRSQKVSWLPWKAVALSISLWLSLLTVDVRAMLRVKKRTQIPARNVNLFAEREKYSRTKEPCFEAHLPCCSCWRKKAFFLCLSVQSLVTHWEVVSRTICTNLGNARVTWWELSFPRAQPAFLLAVASQ